VGDALGATLEFMSRAEVRERYGVLRDIVGGGWLRLAPGAVTDDSQMALCIARSIVGRGAFDAQDVARHFVAWYRSHPPDIGNTTRHALALLDAGVSWDQAGARTHHDLRPNDASNGSIMRAAPVALIARGDRAANARHSADSSRITHANPLCVESCIALNAAIAALLDDPRADALDIAQSAITNAELRSALQDVPGESPETLDAGGFVLATLRSAFWAVTRHDALEEAIIAAVNLGADADTTGAVAGALAGARWGYAALPRRWLDVLRCHDELVALADGLLELSLGGTHDE
jgi:ADP-ribosyl-[dinitrogen reductase] hydrolase